MSILEKQRFKYSQCITTLTFFTKDSSGQVLMRFAQAYGFRNITNIVRQIKTKSLNYQFVEVMACPCGIRVSLIVFTFVGCLNGGGQVRSATTQQAEQLLAQVEVIYEKQVYYSL